MTASKRPLGITEVVLRDGHQSLFATRMRLADMLPIAEKLDQTVDLNESASDKLDDIDQASLEVAKEQPTAKEEAPKKTAAKKPAAKEEAPKKTAAKKPAAKEEAPKKTTKKEQPKESWWSRFLK